MDFIKNYSPEKKWFLDETGLNSSRQWFLQTHTSLARELYSIKLWKNWRFRRGFTEFMLSLVTFEQRSSIASWSVHLLNSSQATKAAAKSAARFCWLPQGKRRAISAVVWLHFVYNRTSWLLNSSEFDPYYFLLLSFSSQSTNNPQEHFYKQAADIFPVLITSGETISCLRENSVI